MAAALVDNWNDNVRPSDEVWHLGDVVMGKAEQSLAVVAQLHGRKHLVPGNHDRCPSGHENVGTWPQRCAAAGFTVPHNQVTLDLVGTQILACHFPYVGDSHDRDRYAEHRPVARGGWLVHGHVHERWRQRGRMINVGVDVYELGARSRRRRRGARRRRSTTAGSWGNAGTRSVLLLSTGRPSRSRTWLWR